jgi:hypothetical protein
MVHRYLTSTSITDSEHQWDANQTFADDILLRFGTGSDQVLFNRSSALAADAELSGVVVGTSDTLATAANSLMISNVTGDGDIHMLVTKGSNTHTVLLADGSTGDTILNASSGQSVDIYIAGTKEVDISASAVDLNNNSLLNVGGSNNDWTLDTLNHASSTTQVAMTVATSNNSAEALMIVFAGNRGTGNVSTNDKPVILRMRGDTTAGANQAVGDFILKTTDEANNDTQFEWSLRSGGGENEAMKLSDVGVLSVDLGGSGSAAQVDLFDRFDDAMVLRDFHWGMAGLITEAQRDANRALLVDAGILEEKDTGSGYYLSIQPMLRLISGGIYQTRGLLDTQYDALDSRLSALEGALAGTK